MCGIDGFLDLRRSVARGRPDRHRRRDDHDARASGSGRVRLLGRRRCRHRARAPSPLDHRPHRAGAQPMHSASGRYVISYNGEIYNADDLADELAALGHRLRAATATPRCCSRRSTPGASTARSTASNGMFAFALWDRRGAARCTSCATAWARSPSTTAGSATRCSSAPSSRRCARTPPSAARSTATRSRPTSASNCVPGPRSIFAGVRKLPPGIGAHHRRRRDRDRARGEPRCRTGRPSTRTPTTHGAHRSPTTTRSTRSRSCCSTRRRCACVPTCRSARSCRAASTRPRSSWRSCSGTAPMPVRTFTIGSHVGHLQRGRPRRGDRDRSSAPTTPS